MVDRNTENFTKPENLQSDIRNLLKDFVQSCIDNKDSNHIHALFNERSLLTAQHWVDKNLPAMERVINGLFSHQHNDLDTHSQQDLAIAAQMQQDSASILSMVSGGSVTDGDLSRLSQHSIVGRESYFASGYIANALSQGREAIAKRILSSTFGRSVGSDCNNFATVGQLKTEINKNAYST
jgi:hypothetical protein